MQLKVNATVLNVKKKLHSLNIKPTFKIQKEIKENQGSQGRPEFSLVTCRDFQHSLGWVCYDYGVRGTQAGPMAGERPICIQIELGCRVY